MRNRHYGSFHNKVSSSSEKCRGECCAECRTEDRQGGELISFVDADDYLHPQMYDNMIAAMTESHSDIGVCDFQFVREEDFVELSKCTKLYYEQLSAEEYIAKLCTIPPTFYNSCWNKVFSRNCMMEIFDTSISICEDAKFLVQNVNNDSKICYVPNKLYFVLAWSGSTTRQNTLLFLKEPMVRKEICEIIRKKFPVAYPSAYKLYIDRCFHVASMQERKSRAEKKAKKYLIEAIIGANKVGGISIEDRIRYIYIYMRMILSRRKN